MVNKKASSSGLRAARPPKSKASSRPSSGGPVKAKAPRLPVAAYKKQLLEMQEGLSRTVLARPMREAGREEPGDEADQASQSLEKEILFELSGNERLMLDQIEAALKRIKQGTYGLCERCRNPIPKARLDAIPYTRYCLACQSSSERVVEAPSEGAEAMPGIEEQATAVEGEP